MTPAEARCARLGEVALAAAQQVAADAPPLSEATRLALQDALREPIGDVAPAEAAAS